MGACASAPLEFRNYKAPEPAKEEETEAPVAPTIESESVKTEEKADAAVEEAQSKEEAAEPAAPEEVKEEEEELEKAEETKEEKPDADKVDEKSAQ